MKNIHNLSSLRDVLQRANQPRNEYNLNEGDEYSVDTVNYIKKIGDKWQIGVFERGDFHDVHNINTEAEACQRFLEEFYPRIAKVRT